MSGLLVDTHVFLWMQAAPERLGEIRERLESATEDVYLSAASAWELSIKYSLGKIALPEPPAAYVPSRMSISALQGLPVTHAHAVAVAGLPWHHRDPFDRLLVAQAQLERLVLVTADEAIDPYEVETIRIGRPLR